MECDVCKEFKDKDNFKCDGCNSTLCKSCGKLTASEVKVLQLSNRILKFYCSKCRKTETFALLYKVIESKERLIEAKEDIIESKIEMIIKLQKEIEDLKSNQIPELLSLPKSYASCVNSSQMKQTQQLHNIPGIIIKPKQNQSADKTKAEINNSINPSELKISVKNMRTIKNGCIVINCPSKYDLEILQKEAVNKLKEKYDVEITKMRKPRIKIIADGLDSQLTNKELEDCIRQQNKTFAEEDSFSVTYVQKKVNRSVIYGECSASLFNKLILNKKIFINWKRYPVYEDLSIARCFRCQELYHKKNNCQNNLVCSYCSGKHEYAQCPKLFVRCNNCAMANNKFKMKYDLNHETTNPECPCYKYHIQILRSKIDYTPVNGNNS